LQPRRKVFNYLIIF
jgi:hypothetical protein